MPKYIQILINDPKSFFEGWHKFGDRRASGIRIPDDASDADIERMITRIKETNVAYYKEQHPSAKFKLRIVTLIK